MVIMPALISILMFSTFLLEQFKHTYRKLTRKLYEIIFANTTKKDYVIVM